MKGRPSIHRDEELVLKAQEVFWKRGYNATSLNDLATATGAGAGSLYNTFKGGKKELFKKALEQRREDLISFKQSVEISQEPLSLIKNFFLDLATADKLTHQKGCIVANTLVEMSFIDKELENEAIIILKETEELYTAIIAREQQKGTIRSTTPADIISKQLITFWCGINSLRRIYPDAKTLKQQILLQLRILE